MTFLLEEDGNETLAAALSLIDAEANRVAVHDGAGLPSLDDPEAAELLDALSASTNTLMLAIGSGKTSSASSTDSDDSGDASLGSWSSSGSRKRQQVSPAPGVQLTPTLPFPLQFPVSSSAMSSAFVGPTEGGSLVPSASSAATTAAATLGSKTQQKKKYVRKKPLSYNPNKARDERKLELQYLRETVKNMELKVQRLRATKAQRSDSGDHVTEEQALARPPSPVSSQGGTNETDTSITDDGVPRVWEKMCARQLERRVKVESENVRLKEVLEGQLKIAKSLEALLKKRTVLHAMETCGSNKRTKRVQVPKTSANDVEVFKELLAGIAASYLEVDGVFEANGLGRMDKPQSDAQMRDGVNGMYLEIFENKLVPFGMHDTGEAVWQHFKGTRDLPYRWHHSKTAGPLETTEDSIVDSFGMEMCDAKSNTTAQFLVKQILRRYVEEDRVVIVWHSHIEPLEFSNKRFAGIHFKEKGYVVCKPRRNRDGEPSDDFTLLQTCYIITPDLSDQRLNDDAKTGALTEFVMSSTAANISASHEMIENVLLDQALKRQSRV